MYARTRKVQILKSAISFTAIAAALTIAHVAHADAGKGAGGAPDLTPANFINPPRSVRPMYRWWLPLGATEPEELQRELSEMSQVGAGGVEIDAVPVPGRMGHSDSFLKQQGWGTPAWSKSLETIYAAAKRDRLRVDLMASALYPMTAPTTSQINSPAIQQQLLFGFEKLAPGSSRVGALPAPTVRPPTFATRLCNTTALSDKEVEVSEVTGLAVGDHLTIGEKNPESVTITSVRPSIGSACVTLSRDAIQGSDQLEVDSLSPNLTRGTKLKLGSQGATEDVTVADVRDAGKGAIVTVSKPLLEPHFKGDPLVSNPSIVQISPGLKEVHESGADVRDIARTKLIAVVAARCATEDCPETGGKRLLDSASVLDLKEFVKDGDLDWTAPSDGRSWFLIAFYQTADGQFVPNLTSTSPNYVIDYIGRSGIEAFTQAFDQTVLTPKLRGLMRADGGSLFEDSYEPSNGLKWTSNFVQEFEARRGYSITPFLPVLAGSGMGAQRGYFEYSDVGKRVKEDYRQTWSDLYLENHLKPFGSWAHSLGLTSRVQIEGGPMEVADLAQYADIPEGENRNFLNNSELWKPIALGAQLRPFESVVSDECCPVDKGVWATTAGGPPYTIAQGTGAPYGQAGNNANLNWIYKAFAGGVNQIIWHGFPYIATPLGTGERSLWPGNSFEGNKGFSEAFGPRMPQWQDYRRINDHLARLQLVLRQGHPQYDVVVFWHDFGERGILPNVTPYTGYPELSKMFGSTSTLDQAGYTYQYLSPQYVNRLTASDVVDRTLLPQKLGARAIILYDQEIMPLESLRQIRELVVSDGFPLVIVGRPPSRVPGMDNRSDAEVQTIVGDLKARAAAPSANVAFVDTELDLPATLRKLGVQPALQHVSAPSSADILAVHRVTPGADYYFLFNQSVTRAKQTLAFSGRGVPVVLNTWTGTEEPVGAYNSDDNRIEMPVDIGPNDVKVVAIQRAGQQTTSNHLTLKSGTVVWKMGHLYLRTMVPGKGSVEFPNEAKRSLDSEHPLPDISLAHWTLAIESWTPDASLMPGLDHTSRRVLSPIRISADKDGKLPSWTAIGRPDLAGVGFYRTTIEYHRQQIGDGAYLDLGKVVDTFQVKVNGTKVNDINYQDTSSIDLGPYLHEGSNLLEIRVATPLRNAVEAATHAGAADLTDYGLIGPVRLNLYHDYRLDLHPDRRP